MPTQLSLYNGALLVIGERKLASLSENREPRRVLDDVWNAGAIRYILSQGLWNSAIRTVRIDYDPGIEPDFGYRRAFEKPEDWVRTAGVAGDEYFNAPLTRYADEQGYWFADLDQLFVRIVSDDAQYGGDLSLWPETLTEWAHHWLGLKICKRITGNATDVETLKRDAKRLLIDARSKDAMNEPTSFLPQGNWSRSRSGGWSRKGRER